MTSALPRLLATLRNLSPDIGEHAFLARSCGYEEAVIAAALKRSPAVVDAALVRFEVRLAGDTRARRRVEWLSGRRVRA